MAPPFRLGLVGIGDMAELHAAAARRLGVDLAIASGRNATRAQVLADRAGGRLYASYDALLRDPTVEAVDICVPNDLHRPFAERAFAARKHVLCEKPIALTLEDADAMISGARQAGVTLMVGHVLRFWPEYRQLRELYAAGTLGHARWFAARRLTGVLAATHGAAGWRSLPARGGGAAIDLQIHDLDFLCWLFGAPAAVSSYGVRSAEGAWNHVVTALRYDGGYGASIEASFLLPGDPLEIGFRLLTDRVSVVYRYSPEQFALHGLHGESGGNVPSLLLYESGQEPRALAQPTDDSFTSAIQGEIAEVIASIREHRTPACTGEEARLALAVALASLRSCEEGATIAVSR